MAEAPGPATQVRSWQEMPDWRAGLLPRRTPADATGEVAAIVPRLCCAPTAPAPDRGRRRRQGGPRDETKRQSRLRLVR